MASNPIAIYAHRPSASHPVLPCWFPAMAMDAMVCGWQSKASESTPSTSLPSESSAPATLRATPA